MPNFITSRKLWFGLGGTALFLGLFFWRTDLSELTDALGDATYWWMIPAVAIWFVSAAVRSLRWHYLLRHIAGLSTVTLYPILVVGYMANNLLPLRTGELVRAYILGERHRVSKLSALGTIALERLFDGLVLVPVLVLVGAFLGFSSDLRVLAIAMAAVFAVALALFLGLGSLQSPWVTAAVLLTTAVSWALEALMYYLVGLSFDIGEGFAVYLMV